MVSISGNHYIKTQITVLRRHGSGSKTSGFVTGPGGFFATRLAIESGGLATNPPCDKPIEDCSTLHRGPQQGLVTEGSRQSFVTEGGGDRETPYFEPHPFRYSHQTIINSLAHIGNLMGSRTIFRVDISLDSIYRGYIVGPRVLIQGSMFFWLTRNIDRSSYGFPPFHGLLPAFVDQVVTFPARCEEAWEASRRCAAALDDARGPESLHAGT